VRRLDQSSKRSALLLLIASTLLLTALVTTAMARSPERRDRSAHRHAKRFHYGIAKRHALRSRHQRRETRLAKTAAPSSRDGSGLLFRATHLRDFWVRQSAPGAITEAPDPAGSGETVFKLVVSDDDVYPVTPTENPRAEMLSPNTIEAGDEIWWSAKFFLPGDFPSSTPNFVTLLQGPYGPPWAGTPPFHIEVNGGVIKWQRNSTYGWDIPWQMPLVRGRWVNFMIHERFGADGWVEMWVDGQPITFFAGGTVNPSQIAPTQHLAMATMDSSNDGQPNSIYLQSYRKKGMFPSLTVYHGPLTIGTTRASVGG
jgi:Polysaccharide lyase